MKNISDNVLVVPDIHGRKFWTEPCKDIDSFSKIVFLGDYLDPYDFEGISNSEAVDNFKDVIRFRESNPNKVVLLLGNHDLPYFSDYYYSLSDYHCRHMYKYHQVIHDMFNENRGLFSIAFLMNNEIIFTHAGIPSEWLYNDAGIDKSEKDMKSVCRKINAMPDSREGLKLLSCCGFYRGGKNMCGSCVWADIHEMKDDSLYVRNSLGGMFPIQRKKQIFGHTIQAYYDKYMNIKFGDPIEFGGCKMLDCARTFVLDAAAFKLLA